MQQIYIWHMRLFSVFNSVIIIFVNKASARDAKPLGLLIPVWVAVDTVWNSYRNISCDRYRELFSYIESCIIKLHVLRLRWRSGEGKALSDSSVENHAGKECSKYALIDQ